MAKYAGDLLLLETMRRQADRLTKIANVTKRGQRLSLYPFMPRADIQMDYDFVTPEEWEGLAVSEKGEEDDALPETPAAMTRRGKTVVQTTIIGTEKLKAAATGNARADVAKVSKNRLYQQGITRLVTVPEISIRNMQADERDGGVTSIQPHSIAQTMNFVGMPRIAEQMNVGLRPEVQPSNTAVQTGSVLATVMIAENEIAQQGVRYVGREQLGGDLAAPLLEKTVSAIPMGQLAGRAEQRALLGQTKDWGATLRQPRKMAAAIHVQTEAGTAGEVLRPALKRVLQMDGNGDRVSQSLTGKGYLSGRLTVGVGMSGWEKEADKVSATVRQNEGRLLWPKQVQQALFTEVQPSETWETGERLMQGGVYGRGWTKTNPSLANTSYFDLQENFFAGLPADVWWDDSFSVPSQVQIHNQARLPENEFTGRSKVDAASLMEEMGRRICEEIEASASGFYPS